MTIILLWARIPQKKWSSPHDQQKSPKCSICAQPQKWQNDLCFQGKPFNITVIQVYAPTTYVKEAEVDQIYEDLEDILELTPKEDALFIIGDWNAKLGSQDIPGVTGKFGIVEKKWSRAKANRILPRECMVHRNHPFSTTKVMALHMEITKWSIPKPSWLHSL